MFYKLNKFLRKYVTVIGTAAPLVSKKGEVVYVIVVHIKSYFVIVHVVQ